jgi:DNA-binding MarR family transcriptional regulator
MNTGSLNDQIINNVFKMSRLVKHEMKPNFDLLNLTVIQVHCLVNIRENKKMSMHEIADTFKITMPTTTVMIEKLVKLKLVARFSDDKDRRKTIIILTKKGNDIFEKIRKNKCVSLDNIMSKLTIEEKNQLVKITNKLIE